MLCALCLSIYIERVHMERIPYITSERGNNDGWFFQAKALKETIQEAK